ncbi:MAG: Rrf2 family transcriptional regulator [Phycisphaerae bacterium]|nr:Rrf2 family transcriptional regulator [Phycisphaerae bacterium]
MFALTRKTDYAIIALAHLAQNRDRLCTAREIAEKFRVPTALLMNVLKTLSQSELVRSIRGAKGGYSLAKSPDAVTLSAIIQAIEGPIRFVQCSNHSPMPDPVCELSELCPVKLPIQRIQARLENFLLQVTLAEIVRDAKDPQSAATLTVHGSECRSAACRTSEVTGGAAVEV